MGGNVEDIIAFVNNRIKQRAPEISMKYGMKWSDALTNAVEKIVEDTMKSDKRSIESFAQQEGMREDDLSNAVDKLIEAMIFQAKKDQRNEILPGDFNHALISLRWDIFPFCKPITRLGRGIT